MRALDRKLFRDLGRMRVQAIRAAVDFHSLAFTRRDHEVKKPLLHSRTVVIGLKSPFRSGLRFPGLINPVEHLVDLLALQLGEDLDRELSHRVAGRIERAVGRIDRDKPVVGSL